MKGTVVGMDGKKGGEVELPAAFGEPVRPDLIQRAVLHEMSRTRQPKGVNPLAGLQTTASYRGRKEAYRSLKNKGISRLPRVKLQKGKYGEVRIVPFARKGRRAHPPKPEENLVEKMNEKEYRKAINSAIAATASKESLKARHYALDGMTLPIILEKKSEQLVKAKDVVAFLQKLKLDGEVERARDGRKKKSGYDKMRRGGYDTPKRLLLVAVDGAPLLRAAKNLPGLEVSTPKNLRARQLAPGGLPGRLAIWTEGALKEMSGELTSPAGRYVR